MIGKYSKVDWSKAPERATHVGISTNRVIFYKQGGWYWRFWNNNVQGWWESEDELRSGYTLYSKEEDLKMKEVKSIADLEVGMFLKTKSNKTILITSPLVSGRIKSSYDVFNNTDGGEWNEDGYHLFTSWSYTLNGEYTPIIHEPVLTPEQLKINELEQTIANASKQLDELKGLRNDNSNN